MELNEKYMIDPQNEAMQVTHKNIGINISLLHFQLINSHVVIPEPIAGKTRRSPLSLIVGLPKA